MTIYHSSRHTIRKALSLLLQNGYIQKNKGEGSFILEHDKIAFPVSSYLKQELYIEKGNVYHIERIRKIDNEKIILDIDYVHESLIKEIIQDSLCEYIEKE